jgi:hypothetical protein
MKMNTQQEENTSNTGKQQGAMAAVTSVKLTLFWPHSPALWFSQAECQFLVRGVGDSLQKYCHMVAMLPHESLRLVADLVESPPPAEQYETLKNRLLASHQLTRYQRAERLFAMPELGSRRPSDLMVAMLEVCPHSEEKTDLFTCLFFQGLPRELHILLARADHKDPKALADHAYELWAYHAVPAAQLAQLLRSRARGGGDKASRRCFQGKRRPGPPRTWWRAATAAAAARGV